jgi:hypothetical protein
VVAAERAAFDAQLTGQPPVMDGRLDDACWQSAPGLTNFTQVLPVEGAPPSEQTEVRFVFTRDQLYVAIRCFDSSPREIRATQMQRDASFDPDDFVSLAFDTFARERDGYLFAVNAVGARRDALFSKFSSQNTSWDTVWNARARVDNRSDDVGLNSRIRWTWRPGNDVFLVWNQGWDYDNARFARLNSEVIVKVGMTFRL